MSIKNLSTDTKDTNDTDSATYNFNAENGTYTAVFKVFDSTITFVNIPHSEMMDGVNDLTNGNKSVTMLLDSYVQSGKEQQ